MHSTPDLQMDRAAQSSSSYKISLAWRYNSFSLYVSCQINLASSQALRSARFHTLLGLTAAVM